MCTPHIDLDGRSYPICIDENLLGDARWLASHIVGRRVAVISSETVAPLYLETLLKALQDHEVTSVVLSDGEAYKQWETLQLIFSALLKEQHDRKTTLIALGGDTIGDMASSVAAYYQRGVNFIQVSTTLLSQVDSSVGGKTGVNRPLGKDTIGTFYQPQAVIVDTASLKTLPSCELSAGLAEVIKYGFIYDEPFITWLEAHTDALLTLEPTVITGAIKRSYAARVRVMGADERESGVRATLSLGHIFGHTIETQRDYGIRLHGEAAGAGVVMALEVSHRLDWPNATERDRGIRLLRRTGLSAVPPAEATAEGFMGHMAVDKKMLDDRLCLVLLQGLENAVVTGDFPREILDATLRIDYRVLVSQLEDG